MSIRLLISVGNPEAKNISFFVKDPKVCLDIGANYGEYSFYLSKKFPSSKIYSFEPSPKSFGLLKKIVLYFKLKNVFIEKLALQAMQPSL